MRWAGSFRTSTEIPDMRTFSPSFRLWSGLALLLAPALLGARGCDPESHSICTLEYAPVCGVDGTTYGNACEADRADVDVAYEGECAVACYEIYAPVCGDDGVTYPNDCYAHAAGATIAFEGACACEPAVCPHYLYCEYGMALDASGCETCECAPPPLCPPVLCDLWCEDGFAVDPSTGCETCTCNPPPSNCESDADCSSEEVCLLPACLPVCIDEDGDGACDDDFCGPGVCAPREMERTCTNDAECGDGAACEIVGCTPDCTGEDDCGGPSACYGYCRPLPPPPPPSECTSDVDCGEGGWCDISECLPVGDLTVCGGICRGTEPPPSYCDTDADCGTGAHCETIACAAVCEPSEDGSDTCIWDCPGGICLIDGDEPDAPVPFGI